VELCLYDPRSGHALARYDLPGRTGDVWHGRLSPSRAAPGTHYAFSVHGPDEPEAGQRFDSELALIDPYARALSLDWPWRCRVIEDKFDWGRDQPPATPWRDTVLYELHVKGFTQRHPQVPEAWRGKYLGLTAPPVIDHLKSLGVTAVELLPCQSFVSEQFLRDRDLSNYWGYNSVAWFSPANEYAIDDAVSEFKTMVKALHAAGIEVILDIVFNHTAEGNESGPTFSLKGIDNSIYYRLFPGDLRHYENLTGCGNTLNCEHPQVRTLIVDCLRYWVETLHVDGFRFDLATVLARDADGFNARAAFFSALRSEPTLTFVKLIAEPWDVGLGGYQLGNFPAGWSEWNDRYRDSLRGFWRRDLGKVGDLAERFAGSSDLFRRNGRKPTASINFITAHDGFTLYDWASYNDKHNEANLEQNADGHNHNLSWNCGVEGPTEDPAVSALRRRQMRNMLASLYLSRGIPMLQAGDEMARSQRGNNNAYCQDNEISWIDWTLCDANQDLVQFVGMLARIRRDHPEFNQDRFLKGANRRVGSKDVTWLHPRGGEMTQEDWNDASLQCLGVWYGKAATARLLLLFNAGAEAVTFSLPADSEEKSWICRFATAQIDTVRDLGQLSHYQLASSSLALLER
jgi:glycogen operon protein